jgi:hypothetical protein
MNPESAKSYASTFYLSSTRERKSPIAMGSPKSANESAAWGALPGHVVRLEGNESVREAQEAATWVKAVCESREQRTSQGVWLLGIVIAIFDELPVARLNTDYRQRCFETGTAFFTY